MGTEGIASFACTLEAQDLGGIPFAAFQKVTKDHFQPITITSPIHTYFDFKSRKQQEGESTSQFRNALHMLLVDCEVATKVEHKMLWARQLVFGCRDLNTLQKCAMVLASWRKMWGLCIKQVPAFPYPWGQ